ncbi:MAG TPA: hypothetical protein VF077_09660 [Nitrospiraceae bacterium]
MSDTKPKIGGIEAAQLREMLLKSDDTTLPLFFKSYSIGFAADTFLAAMVLPGERATFLVALAERYPEDWKKALELLTGK